MALFIETKLFFLLSVITLGVGISPFSVYIGDKGG